MWAGINAAMVTQLERIVAEPLPDGDGTPDQTRRLAHAPVLAGSISVETLAATDRLLWQEIEDLMQAGPEVAVVDDRQPPGAPPPPTAPTNVFVSDHEAGVLTFGDGLHGRRLPLGARVFASYEFCQGSAGNVAPLTISTAPTLPSGFTVVNPVRSWGGADAEPVADGEKQVRRYLQHRDRLVSADDFESIAWRAPGADVGRIEVLPAFHPDLIPNEPGAAPGVVTVMAIPRLDPGQPDAPRADSFFLNALCSYLDPRRLVTTELILRGPTYKGIWISAGVDVAAGFSIADVTDAVKQQLRAFLAPISPVAQSGFAIQTGQLLGTPPPAAARGWPLRAPVSSRVLLAETARVAGIVSVADVLLAEGTGAPADTVEMTGLELPRILGISVVAGDPVPITSLRGDLAAPDGAPGAPPPRPLLPVPVIPENCQ
jgi:predicted phage baseplate assembly protein